MFGFFGIILGPVLMIMIVTTIAVYLEVYRGVEMDDDEAPPEEKKRRKLFRRKKKELAPAPAVESAVVDPAAPGLAPNPTAL
jgi:hypothetical protein